MDTRPKSSSTGIPDVGEIKPPLSDADIKRNYDREYDVAHLQSQVFAAMYGVVAYDPKLKNPQQQVADMGLGMGHSSETNFMQHPLLKSSAQFSSSDPEVTPDPEISEGAEQELKNRKEKKLRARLAAQRGFNPTPGVG